jgi:hypothetical protein
VRNALPKASGLALVLFVGWASQQRTPGDIPYVQDLAIAIVLSLLATVFIAARRAYRLRQFGWMAGVVLVWPLSYLYAIVLQRDDLRA